MKYTKKDIRLFRTIDLSAALIGLLILLLWSKAIGLAVLALSLFFLFRPFTDDERLEEKEFDVPEALATRSSLGITDDNFAITAKMMAIYSKVLSSPDHSKHFPDEEALLTAVGVLDAQVYIFQEKSISIEEIKSVAHVATSSENPILELTVEIGKLMSKVDNPELSRREIHSAWEDMRGYVKEVIEGTIDAYPSESKEEEVANGHASMFLSIPQTESYRRRMGMI